MMTTQTSTELTRFEMGSYERREYCEAQNEDGSGPLAERPCEDGLLRRAIRKEIEYHEQYIEYHKKHDHYLYNSVRGGLGQWGPWASARAPRWDVVAQARMVWWASRSVYWAIRSEDDVEPITTMAQAEEIAKQSVEHYIGMYPRYRGAWHKPKWRAEVVREIVRVARMML